MGERTGVGTALHWCAYTGARRICVYLRPNMSLENARGDKRNIKLSARSQGAGACFPHLVHLHIARVEVDYFENLVLRPRLKAAFAVLNRQEVVEDSVSGW